MYHKVLYWAEREENYSREQEEAGGRKGGRRDGKGQDMKEGKRIETEEK